MSNCKHPYIDVTFKKTYTIRTCFQCDASSVRIGRTQSGNRFTRYFFMSGRMAEQYLNNSARLFGEHIKSYHDQL